MSHLDEAHIHSWLDGALPADEGARVEVHIAECRECAARVAEARGLIAASSRILSKLDHVPAVSGHGPAKVTTVPTRASSSGGQGSPQARAARSWFRPAYAAAAVLVIGALGTWASMRQNGLSLGDARDASVASGAAAPAAEPVARAMTDSAVGNAAPAPKDAEIGIVDRSPSLVAPRQLAKAEETRPVTPPSKEPAAALLDQAVDARAREASQQVAAQEANAGARALSRDESQGRANEQKAAAPPPRLGEVVPTASALSARQTIDSTRTVELDKRQQPPARRDRVVLPADSIVRGETRRLQGEMAASRALGAARAPLSRSAAIIDSMVNVFAGCYTVSGNDRATAEGVPSRLALLTRSHRMLGDVQTWIASTTASVPATVDWEWSLDAAFNVLVRRANGGLPLSTSFSSNTPADLLLRRTNCR